VEPARKHSFKAPVRRGLTFMETVCAVAMLALIAAAVMGAFNSIFAQQKRQSYRLGAMELCNRLVLQYLDDPHTMPAKGLPIAYANERYRWELAEIPVRLVPARPDVAEDRANSSVLSVDRMQAISVRVWLSEESGGSEGYDTRIPSATITRLMDPIALRNPDTTKHLAHDATMQRELLEKFRTIGRNAVVAPKNNNKEAGGNKPGAPGSAGGAKGGDLPGGGATGGGAAGAKPPGGRPSTSTPMGGFPAGSPFSSSGGSKGKQ
jgi:hypothetical protein